MSALFGREVELAAVDRFLARAREGYAVLRLEGEAGIGKTAVWLQATRLGGERGATVLSSRPAQAETKLAFASLSDLLAPVGQEVLAELPEPQRRPLEVALLRASPQAADSDPRAVAMGLLSVLQQLTQTSPALVAIDDTQWLDRESAGALAFALRRFDRRRPLGVLVAVRTERGQRVDVLGLDRITNGADRIRLGPLSAGALHRLLSGEGGPILARPALERIQQESDGNPLLAVELVRALTDHGERPRFGEPLPVPDRLAELLRARLAKLPAGARQALLAVALLPAPTAMLIEQTLGPRAADGLTRALRAGLIEFRGDGIRFTHPLYASAVSSSVLPGTRRALHRRLADVVDDAEERARHLALATNAPSESVARTVEQGAALARARGGWATAAELLERASELTAPRRRDAALQRAVAAAEHQLRAGDRPRSRALVEQLLSRPLPPPLHAAALRLLAAISLSDDDAAHAQQLLVEALGHADAGPLQCAIEIDLTMVSANLMDFRGGTAHAYRALELAEQIGDRPLTALALAHCAMMDFLCARGVDWGKVQQSLVMEDPGARAPLAQRPSTLAAFLQLYVGRHDQARTSLARLCAGASAAGDESDLAFLLLWRSWLETRSGDFAAAAELAEESASVAVLTGSASMHGWALTQQAYVHAHRGAAPATRRCCARASDDVRRSGNLLPDLWIAAAQTLLELSLGDVDAAWQASAQLTASLERQGIGEPVLAFYLPDALEALIALGQLGRAEALLTEFEHQARALDRAWALAGGGRCRGLLLAARGDLDAALTAVQQALDEHERTDLPFDRARTLLATGVIQRRRGHRARASVSLGCAHEEFQRMGARLWARRAADERRRIPAGRTAAGPALTPTQERVAQLVARGRTNREIARELFVTEKTVEATLTRIYRHLGLRSRTELAARLAAHPAMSGPERSET